MKKLLLLILLVTVQIANSQNKVSNLKVNKTKVFSQSYTRSKFHDVYQDSLGNNGALRYFKVEMPKGSGKWIEGITIQKWDDKANTIIDKSIIIYLEKKSKIEKIFYNDGKCYVLERLRDKKNKAIHFFAQIFDEKKLLERKKILSVNVEKFPKKYITGNNYLFDEDYWGKFVLSKEKERILFSIDKGIGSSNGEEHELYMFDKGFNLLWDKQYTSPVKDELFRLNNIKVTDDGNVFFLAKIYNEVAQEKRRGEINYNFEFYKISNENQISTEFSTNDFFVNRLVLRDFSNEMIIAGFCSKTKTFGIEGIAFFKFDKSSLKLIKDNYQPFTAELYLDKFGGELKGQLSNYRINHILKLSDDGYFVSAEEFMVSTGNSVSYLFEDIIVLALNPDGSMNWSRNLNKKQTVGGGFGADFSYMQDKGVSYSVLKKENTIHLILNAHKDLRELLGGRIEFKSGNLGGLSKKNSKLFDIVFNKENSEPEILVIQNNKESEVMFNVMDAKRSNNSSELLLYGSKDSNAQFLTIE